jgi:hypothetical protein
MYIKLDWWEIKQTWIEAGYDENYVWEPYKFFKNIWNVFKLLAVVRFWNFKITVNNNCCTVSINFKFKVTVNIKLLCGFIEKWLNSYQSSANSPEINEMNQKTQHKLRRSDS